jgi:hypothetical protein
LIPEVSGQKPLHDINVQGEVPRAGLGAAANYLEALAKLIDEGGNPKPEIFQCGQNSIMFKEDV